jgi:hypothetical protein
MKSWLILMSVLSAIVLSGVSLAFTGVPYAPLPQAAFQVNPYSPPNVSANVQGSPTPDQIPNATLDDTVVNGGFLIKRTGGNNATLGDGVDEQTTWAFDFTSDLAWETFPTSKPLESARLTITLTPKSPAVFQDIIRVQGLADINAPQIQGLSSNTTSTVELELLDFYSSAEVLGILTSADEGHLPMFFADDAIVSSAELTLVSDVTSSGDEEGPVVDALCPGAIPGQNEASQILDVTSAMASNNSLIFNFNVELDQAAKVWVEYHPVGGEDTTLKTPLSESAVTEHQFQVMRLLPDTTYCYQVFATSADSNSSDGSVSNSFPGSFVTGPLPAGLVGSVFNPVSGEQTYDLTLLDFNDADFSGLVAINGDAQVVWYYQHRSATFAVSQEEDYDLVFGQLDGVSLLEIGPDGTLKREITDLLEDDSVCSPAGRWHHESLLQPDEKVYFFGSEIRSVEINGQARDHTGDTVVVWDRAEGTVSTLFSLFDILDPAVDRTPASDITTGFFWRGCAVEEASIDWTHANSLWIDDEENIIISMRHLNQIISVSPDSKSIQWRLGGPGSDFTFPDPNDRFYHQHTAKLLPNGNILLFDNGNGRPLEQGGQFSRALELELDFDKMEARKVWEYRFSPDLFADCCSSAERLDNGNTVLVFGSDAANDLCCRTFTLVEADPQGNAVSVIEMTSPGKQIQYRARPIDSINGESAQS